MSTEGKKQVPIDTGVTVGSKNMKFQNFHAFYSKWHNSGVFQATVKCLTILESSGHWLCSPFIHFKHNVTKCHQMSINVKGFKNQKNYQFFAIFGQKWHFLWDVHWKWPKTSKYGLFLRVLWKKIKKKSIRILGTMCVKMPSQISSVWLHSQNWQKICVFWGANDW